uniref:Pancreatic trypsin inhibitor n=1 Tax=Rhipicephalus appendiculatus TaxID=34631 RepID=A0A131YQP7_RHIAP
MSLTFLVLCGCIISALLRPSQGCKNCCGSCTRPKTPACPNLTNGQSSKARYFPQTGSSECVAASSDHCKGKFYDKAEECKRCCKSYLQNKG